MDGSERKSDVVDEPLAGKQPRSHFGGPYHRDPESESEVEEKASTKSENTDSDSRPFPSISPFCFWTNVTMHEDASDESTRYGGSTGAFNVSDSVNEARQHSPKGSILPVTTSLAASLAASETAGDMIGNEPGREGYSLFSRDTPEVRSSQRESQSYITRSPPEESVSPLDTPKVRSSQRESQDRAGLQANVEELRLRGRRMEVRIQDIDVRLETARWFAYYGGDLEWCMRAWP
jgi:hypothetical protein